MTPDRLAYARGMATLLLKHVRDLPPDVRAAVEAVRDAQDIDTIIDLSYSLYTLHLTSQHVTFAAYTIAAGVPEHEVEALRALTLGNNT